MSVLWLWLWKGGHTHSVTATIYREGTAANNSHRHLKGNGCPCKPTCRTAEYDGEKQGPLTPIKIEGSV